MPDRTLKIAIQKSGRLYEESLDLLKESGLKIDNSQNGQLRANVGNFDAEVYFLRNGDIPRYLEDGVVDLAIIGQNTLLEKQVEVAILEELGFSTCRVSIATPKEKMYSGIQDLNNKKIATSYPETLRNFLKKHGVIAHIHEINGSVELAPAIGLADAICDIISSGNTLYANNLTEREVILKSQAVLAANTQSALSKSHLINELQFRIQSVLKGRNYRYILLNTPNDRLEEVSRILPVLKSPTVLPLMEPGWSSIHSVIKKEDFWTVIGQLKAAGAEDILIIPIEKMVK